MSNFTSIPNGFQNMMHSAIEAEKFVYDNPEIAGFFMRKSLEKWVGFIYESEPQLRIPFDKSLNNLINEPELSDIVRNSVVIDQMNAVRIIGNKAVHPGKSKIKIEEIVHGLKLLHGISYFFINWYNEGDYVKTPVFDEEKIPLAQHIQQKQQERIIEQLKKENEEKAELVKKADELQKALEASRKEAQKITLPPKDPNESLTRLYLIDNQLEEMGWDLSQPNVREFPVHGMPNNKEEGYADYVLWGDNGKPLAVVEAKRTSRDWQAGRHQAELYARNLEKQFGQLPNIFLTNGYHIHFYDWEYPIREVHGYYTKDELELNIQRRTSKLSLNDMEINPDITDRYYQIGAIKAACERLEQKHRGALLVMSMGTGKTRTAASLIDLLSKAGWVKRVLFLADRTALVTQAKNALNEYLPHLPSVNLVTEKEDNSSRLVFSTYQTLINLIDQAKSEDGRLYGVGHFDLIIFDEIHRSVYNKYKAIFNYFDGYRIGLTATPKDTTDKNTYELFGLSPGNPTYNYDLDKAVEDGYLVPYKSYSVQTKFLRDGIKYADLSEEEKAEYEEKFGDPITGEYPDEIEASALDNWLYNSGTVDQILSTLMEFGLKVENGEKLGKTIIFAKKHQHADYIRQRFNANYPHHKDQFLKVIDYREEYRHDLLNDFKLKDRNPQIACSVDMLDTGIDIPEVVNLVFLKPVKSSVKFWQMIGRGTRLCKGLYPEQPNELDEDGWNRQDKKDFLILDFCENFKFFSENPKGVDANKAQSLNEKLFVFRLTLSQLLLAQGGEEETEMGVEMVNYLHQQVVNLNALERDSFVVRPHLKLVDKYLDRKAWDDISKSDTHELVNNIAPLVIDNDQDSSAKSFDLMMFDLIASIIKGDKRQVNLIERLVSVSKKLQKQTNIPQVAKKMNLLKDISGEDYWANISASAIENLRVETRDLIKFLEVESRPIIYTELEDEIKSFTESPAIYERKTFDKEAYKEKIAQFVKEHEYDLTIDKIKKNIKVTKSDIDHLEKMLFDQGSLGSKEVFKDVYENKPLGEFIRSVVGLDKTEAKNAFARISNMANFNSKQMEFVNLIIDYFAVNGVMKTEQLFEAPFKNIHSMGIVNLFGVETTTEITTVINEINSNCLISEIG